MDTHAIPISGRIIFRRTVPAFDNATIHICVEDISYAGALAPQIAWTTLPGITHDPSTKETNGETIIPFTLTIGREVNIDPKNDYGIRVMVEINKRDGHDAEELNSDESLRILTNGYGRHVDITFQ